MGGLFVRLGFVGYVLLLAVLRLGRFPPAVHSVLQSIGLRSAVGILGYLFAGLVVAYVFLWRKTTELRRLTSPEIVEWPMPGQHDLTALEPEQEGASLEPVMDDPERP